jgi:cysteine desulfurase
MPPIYFDYNATTPLDPGVRAAMLPFFEDVFGNPSSIHQIGRRARALLDDARDRASKVLGSKPSELIFTSGGTESNNLAILGTARALKNKGRHLITSAIEHHAVLHCCEYLARYEGFELTVLPVESQGQISPETLKNALKPETILVSLMAANNEIGTVQPIGELGRICREKGVVFHTDAVQCFGKEPFDNIGQFDADLVSICAHKFHGPKGAGLLYIRSPLQPHPIAFGGGHENERRAGTENLAGIVGMVEALERFVHKPIFDKPQLWALTEKLIETNSQIPGVQFVGSRNERLSNTASFVVDSTDSISLLAGLDLEGVCASSGSACSAGSLEPSHVISALGVKRELANALVRFSLGRDSTLEDVDQVCEIFPEVIARARRSKD